MSSGSLMAVRKRTIDSAPTMPSDSTTLLVTARMTILVIIVSATSVPPKEEEYITPEYVFLYTKKMNMPTPKASSSAMTISTTDTLVTFSRNEDLKMSEKLIMVGYFLSNMYVVRLCNIGENERKASGGQGDTLGLSAPNPDQRFHLWIPARNGSVNTSASNGASPAGLRRWERQPLSACAQGAVSYG